MTTETEYLDPEGVTYDSYRQYVLIGLCGLCGCANNEIEADLLTLLCSPDGVIDVRITPYTELLLHVLDNAGLVEHGSSIRYSWLTQKGKAVREQLSLR